MVWFPPRQHEAANRAQRYSVRKTLNDNDKDHYIKQGYDKAVAEMKDAIKTEMSWKTQDDGFIGALEWMLLKLDGVEI